MCTLCDIENDPIGKQEYKTFEQWKEKALEYLHYIEAKAGCKRDEWLWIMGGDEDMKRDGFEYFEYKDSPEGYVDYQLECAQ